ncbi:MAG TPA: TIGR03943 family protein [Cyanothece sp. UBA12306]|nr:TIGR03943 family protein [Cyanothece sp. UBA12306]
MTLFSRLGLPRKLKTLLSGLDILALLTWGALLFKYWVSGQLKLLIHPNYFLLVLVTSIILLILAAFKTGQWVRQLRKKSTQDRENVQHITLFPPGWGSTILIITAISGFVIPPIMFDSQMALQRGISDSLPVTQTQTQEFRATVKPEERSLIDWIRTINAYPEPDAYQGQRAKITGFVVHSPLLPENYIFLSRFILTCCAVDAYPVGLPVRLEVDRNTYPPDTWLEIEGEMTTGTLAVDPKTTSENAAEKRQLVLVAKSIQTIPTPSDPYGY